jgi:hypothetical protein
MQFQGLRERHCSWLDVQPSVSLGSYPSRSRLTPIPEIETTCGPALFGSSQKGLGFDLIVGPPDNEQYRKVCNHY